MPAKKIEHSVYKTPFHVYPPSGKEKKEGLLLKSDLPKKPDRRKRNNKPDICPGKAGHVSQNFPLKLATATQQKISTSQLWPHPEVCAKNDDDWSRTGTAMQT